VDFAMGRDQLIDRSESAAIEFLGNGVGVFGVRVHHSDQSDRFTRRRKLVIDAGVVSSKGAGADYGHGDQGVVCQEILLYLKGS